MGPRLDRVLIGIFGLVLAVVAAPALGQFGGGQFGGAEGPRVGREQMERYAELLELDETQREIAQMMLEDYIDGVQTAMDQMREAAQQARQEFEETRDRSAFADLREMGEQTQERAQALEDQLMGDLRSMLTPEQEARWASVERAHRRLTTLPRGLMSGERVDLFEIVRGLELEGAAADEAQAVLGDYELALDRALMARNDMYEKGIELFRSRDFEALQSHFEDAREASIRVRDTHRTFARRLEAVLPAEKLEAMETAVRRASFPSVYRENRSDRAMAAVMGIEGLSEDQRGQIEAITLATERRMEQVNRRIADTIESNEVNMTIRDMMRGGRRGNEDGTRELFAEKREVIERAIEQLRSVLSEEQAAALEEAIGGSDEDGNAEPRRGAPQRRQGGNRREL
ncbi:MAG: hypothetical protein RIB58_03920 [Phycisphaerales bacterium]